MSYLISKCQTEEKEKKKNPKALAENELSIKVKTNNKKCNLENPNEVDS